MSKMGDQGRSYVTLDDHIALDAARADPTPIRDQEMRKVDIVLERDDGIIVGIEVKASATVKSADFGELRTLAEACKDRFAYGVVLYDSTDLVPFGDKLAAAPLSTLWA